jgi:photosynthetic reaction center cytochrome c subunit
MNMRLIKLVAAVVGVITVACFWVWYKPISAVQRGYPGVAMEGLDTNERLDALTRANVLPAPLPPAVVEGMPKAIDAYKNVKVLGHLSSGEVTRLMTAITTWVAPQQGCVYCHAAQKDADGKEMVDEDGYVIADPEKMDSDERYTKQVARRMLEMTMHVNKDWQTHVKLTGVTCYTCHRGKPVPANIWFDSTETPSALRFIGDRAGQNIASATVGYTALPNDPLRPFLGNTEQIRVISAAALPLDNRASIKQAEWTYGLMMYFSQSLGVNCTHCHNSRSWADWTVSPLARTQAWHGIQMVRDLNQQYLEPLAPLFPANRLGPMGDGPKLACATCHNGAYRPFLGVSQLKDYMVLSSPQPQPEKTVVAPPEPEPAPAPTPAKPGKKG